MTDQEIGEILHRHLQTGPKPHMTISELVHNITVRKLRA